MYSRIILLTLCIVGAYTRTVLDANDTKVGLSKECLDEYGVNLHPEYESKGLDNKFTTQELYCITACLFRDLKIMRADGTIDEVVAMDYLSYENPLDQELFVKSFEKCKGKVGCQLVQCLFEDLDAYVENNSSSASFIHTISKRYITGEPFVVYA